MKILVVDDHPYFRLGIELVLKKHNPEWIVIHAVDGVDAIVNARENLPDLILIDQHMPEVEGDKAILAIRRDYPNIKIILVSNDQSEEVTVANLKAGVDGIVPKVCPDKELILAIEKVMNGGKYFSDRDLQFSWQIEGNRNKKLTSFNGLFTERETEVLKLIVYGITSQRISEVLNISKRTVDNHRISLLKKSKTESTAALIRFAINSGFLEI